MTVRLKLRRQFNVPSSMSMGEAVERIVAESARRNAMYQRNVRGIVSWSRLKVAQEIS